MKEITTDRVVIVGAGLGALYAALKLVPRPVLMISPEVLGEGASSAWHRADWRQRWALKTVRKSTQKIQYKQALVLLILRLPIS